MRGLILLVLSFFAASAALAGEIFGTFTEDGKPLPAGTKIEVVAAGNNYSGETDKFGTYHVFVQEKGKCVLTLHYKEQKPTASIFSYEKATRYDWTVETADGKLTLKRK